MIVVNAVAVILAISVCQAQQAAPVASTTPQPMTTDNTPSNNTDIVAELNQFITYVAKGFDHISASLDSLRDVQNVNERRLQNLTAIVSKLVLAQQNNSVVNPDVLVNQIYALNNFRIDDNSLLKFDQINVSLHTLETTEEAARRLKKKVLGSFGPPVSIVCPGDWKEFGGRCYKFIECQKACTAIYAMHFCERRYGAVLTPVRSMKHQDFLVVKLPGKAIVIGGNDRANEGTWVWRDGSRIADGYTYWNWNTVYYAGNADCLYIDDTTHLWKPYNCNTAVNWWFVCEKDIK